MPAPLDVSDKMMARRRLCGDPELIVSAHYIADIDDALLLPPEFTEAMKQAMEDVHPGILAAAVAGRGNRSDTVRFLRFFDSWNAASVLDQNAAKVLGEDERKALGAFAMTGIDTLGFTR